MISVPYWGLPHDDLMNRKTHELSALADVSRGVDATYALCSLDHERIST